MDVEVTSLYREYPEKITSMVVPVSSYQYGTHNPENFENAYKDHKNIRISHVFENKQPLYESPKCERISHIIGKKSCLNF